MARTAGRWKDSPKKNTLSELQDELMSVRLREAEAQAELRETRQRMLEMETQVSAQLPDHLQGLIYSVLFASNYSSFCALVMALIIGKLDVYLNV